MSQESYEHIIKYVTTTPENTNKNVLVTLFNNIKNDKEEEVDAGDKVVKLIDWEGTVLKEYTRNQIEELTELPTPDTFTAYNNVDHELLLFQEWNWSLADIKAWLTNHAQGKLNVGAIYTTTDGQDHNYWASPRGEGVRNINKQKRGNASIGFEAFAYCYSLISVNIPDGVTSIGGGVFNNCCSLTSVSVPNALRVTSIGTYAFYNCYSLSSINIPDGVTYIGTSAFEGCRSLSSINIPDGVTYIGISAFRDCRSLSSINIPDGVTYIESSAFENCNNIFDILLESKPILSDTNAFSGTPSTQKIYVPRANISWFENTTNWVYFSDRFIAIEDNIEYLESLGYNVNKYKN